MKLRYYLRGLGIGMLVTALIMGMTSEAGRPRTDAEIRAKALTLGMVEADNLNLSDLGDAAASPVSVPGQDGDVSSEDQEEDPAGNPDSREMGEPSGSPDGRETESSAPMASVAPAVSPAPWETPEQESVPEQETVTILIVYGDSSYTVSRRLEEAGLVESASEYDTYLEDNGYSKSIRTGTYQIPVGATWEEIAEIIT